MVVYRKVDEFEDAPAINPPALFGRRSPLTAEELRTVDTIHRTGSGTKQPTVMSGWSLNDIALNNNTISRLAVRVGVEGSESDYYLNTEIISNICLRAILKQNTNYEKKICYVDSEFFDVYDQQTKFSWTTSAAGVKAKEDWMERRKRVVLNPKESGLVLERFSQLDYLIVICNSSNNHWYLMLLDVKRCIVSFYDSGGRGHTKKRREVQSCTRYIELLV